MAVEILLPPHAQLVLDRLEQAGFEAWCVGGCLRDSLLGRVPGDWDVATSATPQETLACFGDLPTLDVGAKHGTVTVLADGVPVEVTTFRKDGAYTDARHPDSVKFSRRLDEDLARRDFTVNALAYHPRQGLRDCFGGLADLESKTLRCVGDPQLRFAEDALRVLRCLRFAAVLGFSIHPETQKAAQEAKSLLPALSGERVREELTKLLLGKWADQVLRENSAVLFALLPELAPMLDCTQETKYHCYTVWEHTLHALAAAGRDPLVRWAVLLHDSGKPAAKFFSSDGVAHFHGHAKISLSIAETVLRRLRFSNRDREEALALVGAHSQPLPLSEKRVKRLLAGLGRDTSFRLFQVMAADLSGKTPAICREELAQVQAARQLAEEVLSQGACFTLKQLAVHGGDLLAMGFVPGKALGNALSQLLDCVVEGRLPNDRDALLARARELLQARGNGSAPRGLP